MFDPVAKVPPGAKSLRTVQWTDAEGRAFTVLVPLGMRVADNLKGYYWAVRDGLLAAGVTLSEFVLVTLDNEIVARSCAGPDDDADDLAWLSCFFMELMQCRLAFVVRTGVANA